MCLHALLSDVDASLSLPSAFCSVGLLLFSSSVLLLLLLLFSSSPIFLLAILVLSSNVDAEATMCPSAGRTTRPTTWRLLKNTCKRCATFPPIFDATASDDDDILYTHRDIKCIFSNSFSNFQKRSGSNRAFVDYIINAPLNPPKQTEKSRPFSLFFFIPSFALCSVKVFHGGVSKRRYLGFLNLRQKLVRSSFSSFNTFCTYNCSFFVASSSERTKLRVEKRSGAHKITKAV